MPVTSSPVWDAAQSGLIGDAAATAASAQVNQLLTTHPDTVLYQGAPIFTPGGSGGAGWAYPLSAQDVDQPFTMSGTVVGRVQIPLLAVGDGADLLVSLCADNTGSPGTVITQTRIPASWITQLSGVVGAGGPASQYPATVGSGNPLATALFNSYRSSVVTIEPYAYPAVSASGVAASSTGAYYDTGAGVGYLYLVGGVNSGAALNSTFSIAGGTGGDVGSALPQPAFPQATDGSGRAAVCSEPDGTTTSLIVAGGAATFGGTPTGAVYISTVDVATGNLGAWSSQTPVPVNIQNEGLAAYNGYVYAVGGWSAPGGTVYSTVYYAQVQNGQITAWNTTTPYPLAISLPWISVVGGRLFVAGGATTTALTTTTATYYAEINSDGSLGPWIPGPPVASGTLCASGTALSGAFGVMLPGYDNDTQFIGFDGNGPAPYGVDLHFHFGVSSNWYVSAGVESIEANNVIYVGEEFIYLTASAVPAISVPLPAAGLTSGATYHILMQQQGGDLVDYLVLWDDLDALPGNPTVLTSVRDTYSWTSGVAGHEVPLQVFDQTVVGAPWHTWGDSGAHVTTLINTTTPDRRLLGACEATRTQMARNANQGFETGIAPWTVQNAAMVQSAARVKEGLRAAQITPDGISAQCSITSEQTLPCQPGQAIIVAGQFWFTAAVAAANFSLSVAWYTQTGAPVSTSNVFTTMPAAAYTPVTNTLTAPAGAYRYAIVPTLQGTPAASQIWFADCVYSTDLMTPQQSTVTQCNYPGTWPGETWPMLSTTALA